MASDLELGCRLLLWLERVAFLNAYMLAAMFPALGFTLSLAFHVLYFVRWFIQSDNPRLKSDSWVLFIPEHVAAVLLEAYLIFGRPPRLASTALFLFGGSSAIRLLLAWWAKHSGEVAKVWAEVFDEGTKKTREENSVAKPPPPIVLTKKKKTPVVSKVEQEVARRGSPEKETAAVTKPNPTPLKAAMAHEEKTSKAHIVDKLDETAKPAAQFEANGEDVLNAPQATCGSGEPLLGQPHEITPGDESLPSQEPTHMCALPPAPGAGMYGFCLQSEVGEYRGSWGGGHYASPWARERDYLLEELDKANAAANDYYQVAAQYSIDVYQLTTENHQLFLKLEDLTARHNIDREEQVLLREGFKALCDQASYLEGKKRDEVLCAEYYKECCLEYSEGKGVLQEENARLQAEVEDLRKWLDESECELQALQLDFQALENAQPEHETDELRKQLDESECKCHALEVENAQLGAKTEELRKLLDKSECTREDLEEENARLGADSKELRKYLDEFDCKYEALEEVNAPLRAETKELRMHLDESECKCHALEVENAQLGAETEELRKHLDKSEYTREDLEEENAQVCAESEELRKYLDEFDCECEALEELNAQLRAEAEELRMHLDESKCKRQDLKEENAAQLVDETEELRNYLDNSERKCVALEKAKAQFRAETEELIKRLEESECKHRILEEKAWLGAETGEVRKQLDESERKRQALEEANASLETNLSISIALCEVYCFVLKYISLFNGVNS